LDSKAILPETGGITGGWVDYSATSPVGGGVGVTVVAAGMAAEALEISEGWLGSQGSRS